MKYITIYAQEMIRIKSLPGLWTDTQTHKYHEWNDPKL